MSRLTSISVALIVTMVALPAGQAATRTWQATGGSASFNVAGNWGTGGVPGSLDTAAFTGATATTCNITASATIAAVTVSGNATLALTAGKTLTVTGDYTQTANTPTVAISGGILEVTGAFNQSAGSFTQSSGTLLLDSASTKNLTTHSASFFNLAVNDGLGGYWKLDEGTTPVADSSGWGNSGTLFNSPTWTAGATLNFTNANAMVVNGSTQYGQVTRTTQLEPAAITVALWAKRNGAQTQYAQMVTKRYTNASPYISYDLHLNHPGNDSSVVNWEIAAPTQVEVSTATGAMADGIWTHIVGVYDPGGSSPQQRLYINGVLSASGTSTSALVYDTTATGDLYLGQAGRNLQYFNGALDEIRVYDRALGDDEINSLYIGNQPGTGNGTLTLSGSPTVSSDLTLATGTLSVGSGNLTVSGSWNNYGGIFTAGSSTVTLNSTGSEVIRSAGQPFNNLTLSGSGATWTLEDWLRVNGSLTMTNGALSPGSSSIHVSDLNKTSGTFTAGTGEVVIDTTGSVTQSTGFAFNNLRVETPNETSLVGYWKLDEGQGPTTRDATGSGNAGTLSGGANWIDTPLPSTTFDNHAAASFNGTSAYVSLGSPAVLNFSGQITMAAWVKASSTAGVRNIIAHGYNAAGTSEVFLRIDNGVYEAGSFVASTTYQTTYAVPGGDANTWVHMAAVYDGTTWRLYRNGVAVGTPLVTGNGSITIATTNWAIGARGDGTSRWFSGQIDDVRIYNVGLTATQVAALYAGGYAGTGGGATVTLGANLTVNQTLAIDNGTLNTSTFTVNAAATDSTKTALVNAGTLQVGSNTVTFNGGLTVGAQGTVTEDTAGGAIALGTGEALEYDLSGVILGFPTASFDWNSFAFWREYIAFSSYVSGGTTADTVFARSADGGEKYSWSLPSGKGSLIGTPRWNTEGTMPAVHYIYLITTLGYVYKVLDDGTALTTVAGWPYRNGASATATSPLVNDSSNLYWSGKDGAGTAKIFSLTLAGALNGTPLAIAAVTAAPALATVNGTNYVFFGIANHVYQETLNLGSQFASTQPTTAVNGRVTVYNNIVYFPENNGKVWALTATNSAAPTTTWSYQDTNVGRHSSGCSDGNVCSVKNLYVDIPQGRTCFGDQDGHVYVLSSSGTALNSNYPFRPGTSGDVFSYAPLSRNGVLLIGAANGKVYEIDENNGTGPALSRTYTLPAAVNSISFNPSANGGNGAYTVGTSDGKLFYLVAGTDPTPGST